MTRNKKLWAASAALLVMASAVAANAFAGGSTGRTLRWDIVTVDFVNGAFDAGGIASAYANDGSKMTITGMGTFVPGKFKQVTGGGTWTTFDPLGIETASGTYQVVRLFQWKRAPGSPTSFEDRIGDPEDARAGLVKLKVKFSDGSRGHLLVSCALVGSPASIFEGITISKSFVDYWQREAPPPPPGDANRTVFHRVR